MSESRFPMTFDQCPACGCRDTITRVAWDEEADKGRVDKSTSVAAEHFQVPMVDPKKTLGITAGVLMIHVDYCLECGTRYCVKAEVVDSQIQMKPMPPQGLGRRLQ